ncbi:MAG: DUF1501 domain-containing protein [Rhodothermales bacterium]
MCDHHDHHAPAAAEPEVTAAEGRAIALEHGADHDRDHALWSRRDFITRSSVAAGAASFLLGTRQVSALGHAPLLQRLAQLDGNRSLVIVQMAGGNDGLNTIIPITNDRYYQVRPTIAIPGSQAVALDADTGMHPAMNALEPMWGDGQMAVLQTVGYPSHNLSHFRSTDIWASGSPADDYVRSGWTGRYFDNQFPDYGQAPPDFPVAIRIGGATSTLLRGGDLTMGMSLSSPRQLQDLAEDGTIYDEADVPPTAHGDEVAFVRSIFNASFRYRDSVVDAAAAAENSVEYPADGFAETLAVIARMIKGGLGARLYVLQIGGFDTHSNQASRHQQILGRLANGMSAFFADLAAGGAQDDVLAMTFSEFGRRVEENGSNGTDHGTAAPMMLFGGGINGGLYGDAPDLLDLDNAGNLRHSIDFRQAYATVLTQWFGLPTADVENILYDSFEPLGFIADPVAADGGPSAPLDFAVEGNYPNPFTSRTTIRFRLGDAGPVQVRVFDLQGREVRTLVDGPLAAGTHSLSFEALDLPSGTYLYQIETRRGAQSRPMTLVR